MLRAILRLRDFKIAANLAREKIVNFAMTGDGGRFAFGTVYIDRVISSFSQQGAAVMLQMAEQNAAFHRC